MTADVVDALLWRARAVLRLDGAPLLAGHGLADALYRPPRLPYASVLGPLSYTVEPERDVTRQVSLTVRLPGFLAGAPLDGAATVPPPGTLDLLVDADVRVTVDLDHGADGGQPLTDARGRAVADRAQQAWAAALAAPVTTLDGTPVTAQRLAELARVTLRWDGAARRFVVASGRRGPASASSDTASPDATSSDTASSVRLAATTPHAAALGLGDGAITPAGRLARHQVPAPVAMAFDVRVDLWAGSQRHLAALVEAWARVTPTRCQMLLRPGLPASDVPDGAREVRLQARGEPATRWTRLQLEGPDLTDRRTGHPVAPAGGAAAGADGLRLPGGGTATAAFLPRPAVPDPMRPAHPAPAGWSLAADLSATGADGDTRTLATLRRGADPVLEVTLAWVDVPAGNGVPAGLQVRVTVAARAGDGTDLPPATTQVPAAVLAGGARVHALVDATAGRTGAWVDDTGTLGAPVGPVPPAGGDDMELVLGGDAGPQLLVEQVHVVSRPLGPLDHRTRASSAPAGRWRPGDPVTLVRSDDGATPRGTPFTAVVVAVDGDVLTLDRTVVGTWPRHDTLVGTRVVFSRQTAVRRRDDLAANLARISLEHTVSAFVEPEGTSAGARLVERVDAQLLDMPLQPTPDEQAAGVPTGDAPPPPARSGQGSPDVRVELVPARALRSTVTTTPPAADTVTGASDEQG